ncbi:uncharacterized protein LOC122513668 [Polistes fuscatus]|uniref:uncharacterized protein LOC122513668 n=1 Tax=Polistes fuscatus TaxID=30207 RepID=UPI001CA7C821|nr:uncharacterized protein LOC122513668 [Polistes fuscatus]
MCYGTQDWVDVLPVVLLGLRTSFKEDLRATAAELVYGTTLRLPGEYFFSDELANGPQIFLEPLREKMRPVWSAPAAYHSKDRAFSHKTLHSCTHVFVRVGGSSERLCQPYESRSKCWKGYRIAFSASTLMENRRQSDTNQLSSRPLSKRTSPRPWRATTTADLDAKTTSDSLSRSGGVL